MTWLSIVLALLLEQFLPIAKSNPVHSSFKSFAVTIERNFDAGEYRHGVVAWCLAVALPALLTLAVYWGLHAALPLAAWGFSFVILYLTMGFRQFSSAFSGISEALKTGEIDVARRYLAAWTRQSTSELDVNEISRLAIEQGLIDAYRHVFGPLFWFCLLGPAGAVAYRAATIVEREWGERFVRVDEQFGAFSHRVAWLIDWIPIRLTAASFALVGDFVDAVYCWRGQADRWLHEAYGILLAAGAGAIGVRIGLPLRQDHTVKFRPELGVGELADPEALAGAVGLVWRTVIFWLFIAALVTIVLWF
ncbi:CobD/CbiB family protein [Burkholderiaceae bacterium DAT-1]|nr:CobD/CbiB family protein [Burkholderiaceae bacterium DAT-1]